MSTTRDQPLSASPDGAPQTFDRSMGLVATFSLGFTYLSPLAGVLSLLVFALITAGPPAIWWLAIVAGGQALVALVFGEIVSQYPITGGLYPWARRLWGRKYAWLVAWIYLCALIVTITSIAEFAVPYVGSLFGFTPTTGSTLLLSVLLLGITFVLNLAGTKVLSIAARVGFFAEIIGVIAVGLFLLIFQRKNDFSVVFDAMGTAHGGNYFPAFVGAALVGLFLFYGFEACGDVAEEVANPGRQIPRAMYLTIVIGFISAFIAFLGYILAAPNLSAIVSGKVADPISSILTGSLGPVGVKVFLVIALTAFLSCMLSLQAALSRLLFSFARDEMLPGHRWLSRLRTEVGGTGGAPRNAAVVAALAPAIICLWVFLSPDSLTRVTAFAVMGIYVCFQMVVFASLVQRIRGWRPAGIWTLGRAGIVINVLALAYGIAAMVVLAQPGAPTVDFLDRWIVLIGLGIVVAIGVLYMVITRPFGRSNAPENDAIPEAARIRAARSGESINR